MARKPGKQNSGNPNPVRRLENIMPHCYKPGETGNPLGMSVVSRKIIAENTDRALRIHARFLQDIEDQIVRNDHEADEAGDEAGYNSTGLMSERAIKVIQMAQERGLGRPRQAVELSGPNGQPLTTITANMSDREAFEAYMGTLNASAADLSTSDSDED